MCNRTKIAIIFAAVAAAGCTLDSEGGGVRQQLGIQTTAPDEFLIIARRPLEMPQSFDLPRPEPGAPSRVELNPLADAHVSLFKRPDPVRLATASEGEQVLLSGADAEGDNSVVRQVIADEEAPDDSRYGLSTFLGVSTAVSSDEGVQTVRPVEETQLLRRQGYLTPTAPDGLQDAEEPGGGFFTSRGVPSEEDIEASRDPGS